jgi:multisubunit Na+/H+ antiporter MnhG subunit
VSGAFTVALLAVGLLVVMASCIGVSVLDDPLDRLHLVTPASTIGVGACCAAVVVHSGFDASGLSAVFLAGAVGLTSPLVSHAQARSIVVRRRAQAGDAGGAPPESPGSPERP